MPSRFFDFDLAAVDLNRYLAITDSQANTPICAVRRDIRMQQEMSDCRLPLAEQDVLDCQRTIFQPPMSLMGHSARQAPVTIV